MRIIRKENFEFFNKKGVLNERKLVHAHFHQYSEFPKGKLHPYFSRISFTLQTNNKEKNKITPLMKFKFFWFVLLQRDSRGIVQRRKNKFYIDLEIIYSSSELNTLINDKNTNNRWSI